MGGGLESCCVGRVCSADVAQRGMEEAREKSKESSDSAHTSD